MASNLWTLDNPVFAFYALSSGILLFKTLLMSPMTVFQRFTRKSYSWPEDYEREGLPKEIKPPHPMVERVRRCHQNDLENNIPFFVIGLLYTLTNPSIHTARFLFSGFTVARIVHTFVFVNQVRQPSRFLAFLVAISINFTMLISLILHVLPKVN